MGRKKKAEPDDNEQYSWFVQTAQQISDNDSKEEFDEAVGTILAHRRLIQEEKGDRD